MTIALILALIRTRPGLTATEIATTLGRRVHATRRNLVRLTEQGVVRREPHPNGAVGRPGYRYRIGTGNYGPPPAKPHPLEPPLDTGLRFYVSRIGYASSHSSETFAYLVHDRDYAHRTLAEYDAGEIFDAAVRRARAVRHARDLNRWDEEQERVAA